MYCLHVPTKGHRERGCTLSEMSILFIFREQVIVITVDGVDGLFLVLTNYFVNSSSPSFFLFLPADFGFFLFLPADFPPSLFRFYAPNRPLITAALLCSCSEPQEPYGGSPDKPLAQAFPRLQRLPLPSGKTKCGPQAVLRQGLDECVCVCVW